MSPYGPTVGRFKDRVVWDGNPERYDVSIILGRLQFDDNGTYTCQVKNPPDVDGLIGEIQLSVVQTGMTQAGMLPGQRACLSKGEEPFFGDWLSL